jgi:hypothetical protein
MLRLAHPTLAESENVRPIFNRDNPPGDLTPSYVDTVNATLRRLQARKIKKISQGQNEQWTINWILIYLQVHIRRTLSLVRSGAAEIKKGRPLVAALCARAIFEEAAIVWDFVIRINRLLDEGDDDATEEFVLTRTLATKNPEVLRNHGTQFTATSILTIIDRFSKLNPNYRGIYDDLSEIVHPNSGGVFHHFAEHVGKIVTFHDGEKLHDTALACLLQATYIFCADEPEIDKLERRVLEIDD